MKHARSFLRWRRCPALPVVMVVAGGFLASTSLATEPPGGAKPVVFVRDVRPILAKHCFACHGPDEQARKGDLRLDTAAGALDSGAFIPRQPAASHALDRITATDPEERMPPAEAGPPLNAEQIDILRRWVEQGAPWQQHWSFEKPVRPTPPAVRDESWPKSPLDRFVLARLEQAGLTPSPPAEPHVLARRVALDLTGLPPPAEAVEAFVRDPSDATYEQLVDRLLASPAYGERWARLWLDLARYADTRGYEKDRSRTMWRFRDWVIEAFNHDLPYDQFTREQLAGDLLAESTEDQLIATAFHRNTMVNEEGGTDDEEFRVAAVKDRIDTTMQVWMGLTLGCAKCHSHKYDPLSHREYYQFYAFFNQTADSDRGDEFPTLKTFTREQQQQRQVLRRQIRELTGRLESITPELEEAAAAWALSAARPADGSSADKAPAIPEAIRAIVQTGADQRTEAQRQELAKYYATTVAPDRQADRDALKQREEELAAIKPLATPILQELAPDQRRVTKIHVRGNFLEQTETVEPAVPASFHPLPGDAPRNRLGVAQWLTSPDNPLTARVAVNRYWAQFFGTGLVETEEDFGAQGGTPSHPELLDWLACEFQQPQSVPGTTPWSMKQLCKTIVMSATYRQTSRVTPELAERDRFNRLLARGPRFRLEAEMIRDQALAAAGLLSRKMFGPSVMPYQPPGIWRSTYNTDKWETSDGEDKHRRSLYTFIKRTSPYPAMVTLDGPSREICTIRRINTNTPLQALVTLNDPVYVEAAQALARRMKQEGGDVLSQQLAFGLQAVLIRPARPRELELLTSLYQRRLAEFTAQAESAVAFATDPLGPLPEGWSAPELAALTAVANVILNLDECVTRG